jgi:hypothetical protein
MRKPYPKNRAKRGFGVDYARKRVAEATHLAQFQHMCDSHIYRLAVYASLSLHLAKLTNKPVLSDEDRKDRLRRRSSEYRKKNRELVLEKMRNHARKRVKDGRAAAYMREYQKRTEQRLKNAVRCRVWDALKRQSATKRTRSLIGCSAEELIAHIESRFVSGMTWENMGASDGCWVIDHIRPLASFDLSEEAQQKQAFHYTNLQPLWWRDNIVKSSKYNGRKWWHADHLKEAA